MAGPYQPPQFQPGDLALYKVRSRFMRRICGGAHLSVVVVARLGMGDDPDKDCAVRPLGRLGRLWRWHEVRDDELIPLDAVTALGGRAS
jgi:hypothetical protein